MRIGLGIGVCDQAVLGGGGVSFDFYVDSAAAGGGTGTAVSPFNTLAAAAAVLANGSSLGLVDGSYFAEELDKSSLTNVRIGSVPTWLSLSSGGWSAATEPGVYKRTISGAIGLGIVLKEDGSELSCVSSEKMCAQDSGSYWVAYVGTAVVLYLHPTGDGNPSSNGKAYAHRILPFIDCTETLTGWASGAQPNVYKVTGISVPGTGTVYTTVTEDGVLLQRQNSEALSSADPGSDYITADEGMIDIYVHASDDGNPASNGKTYRYSARQYAIHLGDSADVSGIETSGQRHNDGSIVLGANSLLTDCVIRNGHKHNALSGFGSIVRRNRFLEGHYHVDTGIQLVIYSPGAVSGLPDTNVDHNTFVNRGLLARPTQGVYCHTSGANGGTNMYYNSNRWLDCFGAIYAGADNIAGEAHFDLNYITISPGFTTLPYSFLSPYIQAKKMENNKFWFPQPWATTFTPVDKLVEAAAGATCLFSANDLEVAPYFNWVLGATGGAPDITAKNNRGVHHGSAFIRISSSSSTIRECSGNAVGHSGGLPVDTFNTSSILLCNGNHWSGAAGFRKSGTTRTWAAWVATEGLDIASDAAGDNRGTGLKYGQALYGDPRDYPNAWFWYDAQTAASISQSGGDVSAVADLSGHGRNLALHQPVPGTDKVSYSTQGGLPYLAPVANGGLILASQDVAFPIHLFAAVIRLNAALSAASAQQNLLSLSTSFDDPRAIKIGDFGGSFSSEIIGAMQDASGHGYAYTSAVDSYAADTPHLIMLYWDPISDTGLVEIDGVAIGTMTTSSRQTQSILVGNKGQPMMLMRGNNLVKKLAGYLGFMAAFGPISLDGKTALTAYLKTRWGIA